MPSRGGGFDPICSSPPQQAVGSENTHLTHEGISTMRRNTWFFVVPAGAAPSADNEDDGTSSALRLRRHPRPGVPAALPLPTPPRPPPPRPRAGYHSSPPLTERGCYVFFAAVMGRRTGASPNQHRRGVNRRSGIAAGTIAKPASPLSGSPRGESPNPASPIGESPRDRIANRESPIIKS